MCKNPSKEDLIYGEKITVGEFRPNPDYSAKKLKNEKGMC
jgi:hypothetical protein